MIYELVFTTVKDEIRVPLTKELRDKVFEELRATESWSQKTFRCNGMVINLAQVISVSKAEKR